MSHKTRQVCMLHNLIRFIRKPTKSSISLKYATLIKILEITKSFLPNNNKFSFKKVFRQHQIDLVPIMLHIRDVTQPGKLGCLGFNNCQTTIHENSVMKSKM
jgi:hypothetical protein